MKATYILTRHTRPLASGLYQVRLKRTVKRVPQYRDTGVQIRLDQWNKKKREIINHPEAHQLNFLTKKMLLDWERSDLGYADGVDNVDGSDSNVIRFTRSKIASLKAQKKFSTAKRYNTVCGHLLGCFGKNFYFHQVNTQSILKFLDYLYQTIEPRDKSKPSTEGIRNYFLTFKSLVNYAENEDLFTGRNPFKGVKPPKKCQPTPKALWVNELHKITNVQINDYFLDKYLFDAVNVFNLQFWANGSRISDALQLKWRDITPEGIFLTQEKSDKDQAIGLSTNVVSILRWYLDDYRNTWDWRTKQFQWEKEGFEYPDHADTLWHLDMELFKQLKEIKAVKEHILFCNPKWETSGLTEHEIEMKVLAQIPSGMKAELAEIKAARYKEILRQIFDVIQRSERKNDYVFPYLRGVKPDLEAIFKKRDTASALVNRRLKKVAQHLGVRGFASHAARHSLASICVKRGVHIYVIKGLFKHSSIRITENYIDRFPQVDSADVYQEVTSTIGSL